MAPSLAPSAAWLEALTKFVHKKWAKLKSAEKTQAKDAWKGLDYKKRQSQKSQVVTFFKSRTITDETYKEFTDKFGINAAAFYVTLLNIGVLDSKTGKGRKSPSAKKKGKVASKKVDTKVNGKRKLKTTKAVGSASKNKKEKASPAKKQKAGDFDELNSEFDEMKKEFEGYMKRTKKLFEDMKKMKKGFENMKKEYQDMKKTKKSFEGTKIKKMKKMFEDMEKVFEVGKT